MGVVRVLGTHAYSMWRQRRPGRLEALARAEDDHLAFQDVGRVSAETFLHGYLNVVMPTFPRDILNKPEEIEGLHVDVSILYILMTENCSDANPTVTRIVEACGGRSLPKDCKMVPVVSDISGVQARPMGQHSLYSVKLPDRNLEVCVPLEFSSSQKTINAMNMSAMQKSMETEACYHALRRILEKNPGIANSLCIVWGRDVEDAVSQLRLHIV